MLNRSVLPPVRRGEVARDCPWGRGDAEPAAEPSSGTHSPCVRAVCLASCSPRSGSEAATTERPSWVTLPDLAVSHPLHAGALLPQPRIKNVYMEPFYAALYPMQFRASLKDVFCKAERMGILVRCSELCGWEQSGTDVDNRTPHAVRERRRGRNARLVGRFRKLLENGASSSYFCVGSA